MSELFFARLDDSRGMNSLRVAPLFLWFFAACAQPVEPIGQCVPTTCAAVEASCGRVGDGCGGFLDCGGCAVGQGCGVNAAANVCGPLCVPRTCAQLSATCGLQGDGCGGVLDCGACQAPELCGGGGSNRCGTSACVPTTCATLGATCAAVGDGCGAVLNCGTCGAGETCGVAQPNQCGTVSSSDAGGNPCAGVSCGANGQCAVVPAGDPVCVCAQGFTRVGSSCVPASSGDAGVNACTGVSCGPNGQCAVLASGSPICACDLGFARVGSSCVRVPDAGTLCATGSYECTPGTCCPDRPISIVTPGNPPYLVACAVMASGQVRCLSGSFGPHLGGGVPDLGFFPPGSTQSVVIPLPEPAQAIATDSYDGCALFRSGRVACWGIILQAPYWGTPTANPRAQIVPGLPTMDKIFPWNGMFCAGTASGEAWCWGRAVNGFSAATVPAVERVPIAEPIVDLALNPMRASCAVLASGQVKCWGNVAYLGTASCHPGCLTTLSLVRTPTTIPGLSSIRRLSKGSGDGLCAIDQTGRAWCWGGNTEGGLGRGFAGAGTAYQTYVPQPMLDNGVPLTGVTAVVMNGWDTTCVLLTPGEVRCVGNQRDGYLGNGTSSASSVAVLNFVRVGTPSRPLSPLASELLWFGAGFLAWHPGGTQPVIQAWGGTGRNAPTDPMFVF